jgi:hypothetical protein
MANIELVIKIPERAYNLLKTSGVDWLGAEHILNAVANGTPLPEGHGRLIDADEIIYLTNEIEAEDREEELYHLFLKTVLADAPTIIEADKTESENKND